ncbi:MAG: hypothetical protein QW646_08840 [Ignisphaera sp.]
MNVDKSRRRILYVDRPGRAVNQGYPCVEGSECFLMREFLGDWWSWGLVSEGFLLDRLQPLFLTASCFAGLGIHSVLPGYTAVSTLVVKVSIFLVVVLIVSKKI